MERLNSTGAGAEIIEWILGIDPAFDSVSGWEVVLADDRFTRSDLDLFFDQMNQLLEQ